MPPAGHLDHPEEDRHGDRDQRRRDEDGLPADTPIDQRPDGQRGGQRPDAEEEVEQVQGTPASRPKAIEEQAVDPAIDRAGAEPAWQRSEQEDGPRRPETETRQPERVDGHSEPEDRAPTQSLGGEPAAQGSGGVRRRIEKVEDPDPRVGLAEGLLDRADQRRDQQPAPADQQERGAAEDAGRHRPRAGKLGTARC